MARIMIVGGDRGGMKEVVSAGQALANEGHQIDWRVDPHKYARAGLVLGERNISYNQAFPIIKDPRPDIVLVGTSAVATNMQVVATHFAHECGIPCVWVEDFPGCANEQIVRGVSPDMLCVIDDCSREIAENVRPGLRVAVVGKPSYSEEVGPLLKRETDVRREIRGALGLDDRFVVMYAGGQAEETVAHLEVLTDLELTSRTVLVPRLHPTLPDWAREKSGKMLERSNLLIADSSTIKSLERVAIASDVVVCTWGGTVQFCSTLAGVPTVLTLFPDDRSRRSELGYVDGEPPLLRANAGLGAESPKDLRTILCRIASDPQGTFASLLEGAERFVPWVASGATERIVGVCKEFLL